MSKPHNSSSSNQSPLDLISHEFEVLAQSNRAISIDGSLHAGLPRRAIKLAELPSILLHPSTPNDARDAVLRVVCTKARSDEQWMIVLLRLLRPGLKRASQRVGREFPELRFDIEAEMITGVIERLASDVAEPWVASRLVSAALGRARRAIRVERRESAAELSVDEAPPLDDMQEVLDRAVMCGVLTESDAELIARTRIYGEDISAIAEELHRQIPTIRRRRARAELRLRAYLLSFAAER